MIERKPPRALRRRIAKELWKAGTRRYGRANAVSFVDHWRYLEDGQK
jgi:hypothetical protein